MKLDWNRIKRTAIQAASGAGVTLLTAIGSDTSAAAIKAAVIGFAVTVGIAICMNIQKQAEEQ